MKVFQNCIVVLEFDTLTSFKEKTEWRRKVTDNGGIVSYVLTKRVNSSCIAPIKELCSTKKHMCDLLRSGVKLIFCPH